MGGTSGKGKQERKTVQTNAPPAWALPAFQQGAKDALDIYKAGKGGNVYQGQRVADVGTVTRGGIDGIQQAAGGFNNSYLQGLVNGPTASQTNLADMAAGKMVDGNPFFSAGLQNTLNDAATMVNSQMSGAGRYGSGAHNGILANNLGKIATNAYASQYNQDVENMLNANSRIDTANQGQIGAAGNWLRQQGEANEAVTRAGQVLDQNAQNKLNADWQKWQEEDNRDWTRLGFLQNAANGFAGNYGSSTKMVTTPGQNSWKIMNSGGGTIGGLFGKSDIRAKENIVLLGQKNGFPLYEFNYIGKPERWRGVMAQDVLIIKPEAVSVDPQDGLYCVDYSCLGFAMQQVGHGTGA